MTDHFEPCAACGGNGFVRDVRDPRKPLPQLVTYPCPECDSTGVKAPRADWPAEDVRRADHA